MDATTMRLGGDPLSLDDLQRLHAGGVALAIDDAARERVRASAAVVQRAAAGDAPVYGVNTGFGKLAGTRIAADDLALLQLNLIRSHSVGVGEPLAPAVVRLVLALKAASLARGHSGVREEVVDAIIAVHDAGIVPLVPAQGSVGASGDLAPLAHLSLALIGEGRVRVGGKEQDCAAALKAAGIEPLVLGPKEGLALLNGTQVSTSLALEALFAAEDLLAGSIVTGAMAVDAALGSRVPFDARIHNARGQPAQIAVAAAFRAVLGESEIGHSHENCDRVQDPYSLRCQPQVAGACLQQIQDVARTLLLEANGVSDNPLVFGKEGEVLSGGNFHAEPVAFAADNLSLAIAEIGALSERRIAMLIDDSLSQLPAFLVKQGGLNSGFMIAQVTAAALASENKSLAHPASVDSLPTSANQEDHVSMATFAARRLAPMAENTRGVVAIEFLAAAQGIDFRRPLKSSPALEQAHALLRKQVAFYDHDRLFAPDIAAAKSVISSDALISLVPSGLLPSRT